MDARSDIGADESDGTDPVLARALELELNMRKSMMVAVAVLTGCGMSTNDRGAT